MRGNVNNMMLTAHVPVVLLQHLRETPDELVRELDATVMFADVSGFTRLSERLARAGKEGAERLTDVINACFSALLAEAYDNGASLIKFGGDAMLLWFDGADHAGRAATSAIAMRKALREHVRSQTGDSRVALRMSIGLHSGHYDTFLVGGSHREFLIAGPAATRTVAMEGVANAGQILASEQTAALLPASCLGATLGPAVVVSRSPMSVGEPRRKLPEAPAEVVAGCLSTAMRAHLLAAPAAPEHRSAAIAFLQFGSFDQLIADDGVETAARQLDELVRAVQDAADHYEVCFLGSDIAADGGKLLLCAGAPRAVGDDTERLLLALRQVIESKPQLPIRIGINRGHVFAGEVGPFYRRTYTLMGDAVNLAARLMAKARWRSIYATPAVIDRSATRFELTSVPPFMVKGKSKPVTASEVGRALGAEQSKTDVGLPLIGRDEELAILERAVDDARLGNGSLIEIIGETGSGKSRLAAEARKLASDMVQVHAVCESYTQTIPYAAWRDPLRQLLGLTREDPEGLVTRRLRKHVMAYQPELVPWLPLLAIPLGADVQMTEEVRELSSEFRAAKLHETVLAFISRALRVPTLVEIEHAHLMDEASAALLQALGATVGGSSWLVVVTRRDTHGGFETEGGWAQRLELGPLPREAVLALAEATAEAHVVPPHVLELAVDRSGGSPEFLLDLLSAAAGGSGVLPDSIEAAASARIDALDPADRALVRRAALLGLMFDPRRLEAVLEPGSRAPDSDTWKRLRGIFATEADGRLRFRRPALCEVAYEGLPFRLRRQLHASIGTALEPGLGRDVDADPAVLSLHFIRAGDQDRAWKYARLGAERATARFAHADASQLYRRAIDAARSNGVGAVELAQTWEALGESLRQSGDGGAAMQAFTAARRLLPDDPLAQARLCDRHAEVAERRERVNAAVRWVLRGLRLVEQQDAAEAEKWRIRLVARLAGLRDSQGRSVDAERLCRATIPAARATQEMRALARLCWVLDTALVRSGRAAEATHSPEALEIYRALDDPENESKVLNNMSIGAHVQGRWDDALELLEQVAACSRRAGNPADVAFSDCNIGEILSDQGRLDEAATHLQRARRVSSSTGDRHMLAYLNMLLGRLSVRAGDTGQGIALIEVAAADLRRLGLDPYADLGDAMVAEAEAIAGDAERAVGIADQLLEAAGSNVSLLRRARGIALARLGDSVAAIQNLELAATTARGSGEQYELALVLDALESIDGHDDDRQTERDAILRRLDVRHLPGLPASDDDQSSAGSLKLAAEAGRR